MSTIQLQLLGLGDRTPEHLRAVYEAAFPPEERRPWEELFALEGSRHHVCLVRQAGQTIGLAVGWDLPSACYYEYLLIAPAYRGQGLGAEVVRLLQGRNRAARPFVLECEPRGYSPEAERRLAFYARLGLDPQPYDYMQPPYGEGLPWVRLHLLSDRSLELEAYEQIRRDIHQYVYKVMPSAASHDPY